MQRTLAATGVVVVICALAWLFGFDFNERGLAAGFLAYGCIVAFIGVFCSLERSE